MLPVSDWEGEEQTRGRSPDADNARDGKPPGTGPPGTDSTIRRDGNGDAVSSQLRSGRRRYSLRPPFQSLRRFVKGWRTGGHERRLDAHIVNYADDFEITRDLSGQLGGRLVKPQYFLSGDSGQEILQFPSTLLSLIAPDDLHDRDSGDGQKTVALTIGDGVPGNDGIDCLQDLGIDVGVEDRLAQRSKSRQDSSRRWR